MDKVMEVDLAHGCFVIHIVLFYLYNNVLNDEDEIYLVAVVIIIFFPDWQSFEPHVICESQPR